MASFSGGYDVRLLHMADQREEGANDRASGLLVYAETKVLSHGHTFGTLSDGRYIVICINKNNPKDQWLLNFKLGEKPTLQFLLKESGVSQEIDNYHYYLILGPQSVAQDIPIIQRDLGLKEFSRTYQIESDEVSRNTSLSYEASTGTFFCIDSRDGVTLEQYLPLPQHEHDEQLQVLQDYLENIYQREGYKLLPHKIPSVIRKILQAQDKEEVGLLAAEEMKNAGLFESKRVSQICTLLQNLQYSTYSPQRVLAELKSLPTNQNS